MSDQKPPSRLGRRLLMLNAPVAGVAALATAAQRGITRSDTDAFAPMQYIIRSESVRFP